MDRDEILERVRNRDTPWDVVVVGGGATGMGCAVDASSRGLDVLLLEQSDFGKGTSSRSTKLIHGGVRYLAQGNISLVREALRERGMLFRNAPHTVQKIAFVIPCYSLRQNLFYGFGLKIYDVLSGKYSLGRSRIISRDEVIELLPNIESKQLSGGVVYYDGQFDDTRLLIDLARTGHAHGAAILNYARVTRVVKHHDGTIKGLEFEDIETGDTFTAQAKTVVNAAGIFSDSVRSMANPNAKPTLKFSQGVHVVAGRKFLHSDQASMIPKTRDGRVLFCIPWLGALLMGTTDTPVAKAELEPRALEIEIDFILSTVAEYLSPAPKREDILSVFAGIRPLVKTGAGQTTASLSRGHKLFVDGSGLVTITGGKWTTYRKMAADAIDKVVELLQTGPRPSRTEDLKILAPSNETGEAKESRLQPELPYTQTDILRAVREEMARSVEDVLARRTRCLFLNAKAAIEIAPQVARMMAQELGEDNEWVADQLEKFDKTVQNYLPS